MSPKWCYLYLLQAVEDVPRLEAAAQRIWLMGHYENRGIVHDQYRLMGRLIAGYRSAGGGRNLFNLRYIYVGDIFVKYKGFL